MLTNLLNDKNMKQELCLIIGLVPHTLPKYVNSPL